MLFRNLSPARPDGVRIPCTFWLRGFWADWALNGRSWVVKNGRDSEDSWSLLGHRPAGPGQQGEDEAPQGEEKELTVSTNGAGPLCLHFPLLHPLLLYEASRCTGQRVGLQGVSWKCGSCGAVATAMVTPWWWQGPVILPLLWVLMETSLQHPGKDVLSLVALRHLIQ